jgi:hypothetical protein
MNRMAAIRFTAHPEERCSVCGMERAEGGTDCCRDEFNLFKITDDQQPAFTGELINPDFIHIHTSVAVTDADTFTSFNSTGNFVDHGPPGKSGVPLFLRNRIFRI